MLGKLEECVQLLVDSNRIPEAAFMARSYLPSKVSEIVDMWRKDLSKINPKAAESLADWQIALAIESKVAETRGSYPRAEEYLNYADRSKVDLVEVFKSMHAAEEEEPGENGEITHDDEVSIVSVLIFIKNNAKHDEVETAQEEALVVVADSNGSAELVDGKETD
ncbi:Coatomer subunit beta'-2-like protein [Drosera capensis]